MNQMTKTPKFYITRMAEIQKRKGEFSEEQAHKQAQKRCVQLIQQSMSFPPNSMFHVIAELKDEQAAATWKEESDISLELSKIARQRGQAVDVYMEEQRRIALYDSQNTVNESKQTVQKMSEPIERLLWGPLQALDEPAGVWWVTDRPFNPREWENVVYLKPANKWWDFYRGEPNVLIPEISIQEARDIYDLLKMWGDITPFKADAKYKFWKPDGPFIRPKKCVVRSNYTIDQVFGNDEAMKCRFKEIKDDSFHIDALLLF